MLNRVSVLILMLCSSFFLVACNPITYEYYGLKEVSRESMESNHQKDIQITTHFDYAGIAPSIDSKHLKVYRPPLNFDIWITQIGNKDIKQIQGLSEIKMKLMIDNQVVDNIQANDLKNWRRFGDSG